MTETLSTPTSPSTIEELRAAVEDLRVSCDQLQDVLEQSGALPIPPKHLQVRVVGSYRSDFFSAGRQIVDEIEHSVAPQGKTLASFSRILDFGCGCGRIATALARRLQSHQRLFGSDIDPEAIAWCQSKYGHLATFDVSPHAPRTLYADGQFDLVCGISVFTHLPEAMQFDWLRELERITTPDAYLILSIHGKSHLPKLSPPFRAKVEDYGFCYVDFGATDGLPDFYLTTYHSERYVRDRWSEFLISWTSESDRFTPGKIRSCAASGATDCHAVAGCALVASVGRVDQRGAPRGRHTTVSGTAVPVMSSKPALRSIAVRQLLVANHQFVVSSFTDLSRKNIRGKALSL